MCQQIYEHLNVPLHYGVRVDLAPSVVVTVINTGREVGRRTILTLAWFPLRRCTTRKNVVG